MKRNPADLTVSEAGVALRSGALSSVGLTQAHLARIAARNPSIKAFVHIGADDALAHAHAADLAFANGTDTGGSVGSPAAYCGVVGLKPTFGAISLAGVMPLAPALDHVGPIARTVAEAETVVAALMSVPQAACADIAGMRIAYGRNWCVDKDASHNLAELMDNAASTFSLYGACLFLTDLPAYNAIEDAAARIILAGEYATHGSTVEAWPDAIGKSAAASILSGRQISAQKLHQAKQALSEFGVIIDALLAEYNVLILPTTMTTAPPFRAFADGKTIWTAMRTLPFNVTGHPALSLPVGFCDGLPLGMQIIGRRGDEVGICRVGAAFEAATVHSAGDPCFA